MLLAKHTENKSGKKTFFVSACEKYKQHRGQAQKALLKHLLVTGPSMRLRYYMLDFKRSQKKVSACKKYKQHRGQAQQALLKHLLVTALFGRNKDRQKAARMRLRSASATLGQKYAKETKMLKKQERTKNNKKMQAKECKKCQKILKNTKNVKTNKTH